MSVTEIAGFKVRPPRLNRTAHGFPHETNDCTVRALAVAARLDYAAAHDLLKQMGRKDRKGFLLSRRLPKLGFQRIHEGGGRVATALEDLDRSKTYIVRTRAHVFAVADGVVHDSDHKNVYWVKRFGKRILKERRLSRCHVKGIWQAAEMDDWMI